MNPLAKRTFLEYSLTFLGFAIILMGFINPLFFYVIPFKGYTMQHEMQHGNFYKIFLYFGARLTKYLYHPNSVPNHPKIIPTQKGYYIILVPGSSDISDALGHFRTFSEKSVIKSHFSVIKVLYFARFMALLRFRSKTRNSYATHTQLRHIDKLQAS